MSGLLQVLSGVADPRAGNARHRLVDLIVIMLAASACGATRATEFALFAQERRAALSRLIRYETAPSHDTFSRLLRLLQPAALEEVLARLAQGFAAAAAALGGPDVVALDGKALRRAYEKGCAAHPPLTVSAFATQARLCLGAHAPSAGENEVEAALKVVALLDLAGRVVTADALHCHHRMADALAAQGAEYLLALKGNRPAWLKAAKAAFADAPEPDLRQDEVAHDRHEVRRVWVRPAGAPLAAGHRAFVKIEAARNGEAR
jgi:predicted transposase YbfD/YdcC